MGSQVLEDLVFRHLVEFPSFDCTFCSTRDRSTNRTKLFLMFNHKQTVYLRNGLKGTWDEVKDEEKRTAIQRSFDIAVQNRLVPCYSA